MARACPATPRFITIAAEGRGMKPALLLACALTLAFLLIAAGCSQPANQPTPAPTPAPTTVPTAPPETVATPVPTTPAPVPTAVRPAVPLNTIIKDTKLLFTISAPDGFTGTTIRATTSDYSILYKTTICNPAASDAAGVVNDTSGVYRQLDDSLTIFSYSTSYSVDQDVRNAIRSSGAVSSESTVTYKGITYTRFDVASDPFSGKPGETVIFVANKGSANEYGYLPVLIYTLTPSGTLGQASFENMVKSFAYLSSQMIGSAPGQETSRPSFYQ